MTNLMVRFRTGFHGISISFFILLVLRYNSTPANRVVSSGLRRSVDDEEKKKNNGWNA